MAFSSRRTPQELIAEPNSTETPRLSPVSRARSWSIFSRAGRLIHQQLLEQFVVMVGELLEHVGAGLELAVLKVGGDLDPLGLPGRRDI